MTNWNEDLEWERRHLWHPYTSMTKPLPAYGVERAEGVRLHFEGGDSVVDGMSSWWCAVHGYNVAELNAAANRQIQKMAHVMFGGLTHQPAIELGRRLVEKSPEGLDRVFLCDSGSVSVEVAIKMALQYFACRGDERHGLLTIRGGYHGDTFGAMAVCDPVNGMHTLFRGALAQHFFAPRPTVRFDEPWHDDAMCDVDKILDEQQGNIAAIILEPIVQGAGGMWFYHPNYLREIRRRCDERGILLIADEIATGFGRTGTYWGCEHAGIAPDIMCVGKALTGGYMTMAATIATAEVAEGVSRGEPGVFMHGPTFMGNPLGAAIACASIDLLDERDWEREVAAIERHLVTHLHPLAKSTAVEDVRVLGAIGVVEMKRPVDVAVLQRWFVDDGAWIRPFGRLVYIMPPYACTTDDLSVLTMAVANAVQRLEECR